MFVAGLQACASPILVAQRYSVAPANIEQIRKSGAADVALGEFTGPISMKAACRTLGPVNPPDGLSHPEYVRRALADELRMSAAYSEGRPGRVQLTGELAKVEYSTVSGPKGGNWHLALAVTSSNGARLTVEERYVFDAPFFNDDIACRNAAAALSNAVQNLVGKVVAAPEFKALVR